MALLSSPLTAYCQAKKEQNILCFTGNGPGYSALKNGIGLWGMVSTN
jgi:hypothetical protein